MTDDPNPPAPAATFQTVGVTGELRAAPAAVVDPAPAAAAPTVTDLVHVTMTTDATKVFPPPPMPAQTPALDAAAARLTAISDRLEPAIARLEGQVARIKSALAVIDATNAGA
jgi:hypothetical protein